MTIKHFECIKHLFKLCCFITVLYMVSVWIHKFMKNDDLCLVDYKPFGFADDVGRTEVSLCFQDPFVDGKINDLGANASTYVKHLSGKRFDKDIKSVNYTDVTLNLGHYYRGTVITTRNGAQKKVKNGIHSIGAFFYYGFFQQCFTLELKKIHMQNAKYLTHYFNLSLFLQYIKPVDKKVLAWLHGHNQVLLGESFTYLSYDKNETNGVYFGLIIDKIEVLKRRNKPSEPCLDHVDNWDESALFRKIQKVGCWPSYLNANHNFSTCTTANQMKEWSNMISTVRNERNYQPCQTTPRIDFVSSTDFIQVKNNFMVTIGYPEKIKIITQSREVDVNTLIGNIGGYIGLFLGIVFKNLLFCLVFNTL